MKAKRFVSRRERSRMPSRAPHLDVERADRSLLDGLDRELATASDRAGEWLVCHAGCSECCFGPFPITALDARRLGRGLAELRRTDPPLARRISDRARATVEALTDGYPGDPRTGRLSDDVERLDRFFERHESVPCPALDPRKGKCDLYASRPVACRTYGPPLRFDDTDAAPCRLCFRDAPAAVIEACRVEPDRQGRESTILQVIGVAAGGEWETLIPFALTSSCDPRGGRRGG